MSISSLGGQVRNPYDLSRTPGGSSGGTAASVAANFAVLGTGSDTGQSIRSPASANNLVGVRITRGVVSRAGVIPNSLTQDEIGPIARTVADAAILLDIMAGYDPDDPITAFSNGRIPKSYADLLTREAL
jgi:Asp-tRNA(Asn)/Glu-tRNA(Gln) amidotransferase A subunit family amidase